MHSVSSIFAFILSTALGCHITLTYRHTSEKLQVDDSNLKQLKVADTQSVICSLVDFTLSLNYTHRHAEHHHLTIIDTDLFTVSKNPFLASIAYFDKLTLSNLRISNITKDAFDDFNKLQDLDLSHNELVTIPEAVLGLESLYTLDLSKNRIQNLDDVDFSELSKLKFLYLRGNNLQNVSGECFLYLEALYELDLSNNPLNNLYTKVYVESPNLKKIIIRDTPLSDDYFLETRGESALKLIDLSNGRFFDFMTFSELPVEQLILTHNKFTFVQAIPNYVTFLDLSSNKITGLGNLTSFTVKNLNFGFNKIVELKTGTFSYLANLVTLHLNHNNLKLLEKSSINNCISLKNIDLSSNKLTYIQSKAFDELPKLTSLDLSDNNIKGLNLMMLPRRNVVKFLFINSNKIASLDVESFKKTFPTLQAVALDRNPWFCEHLQHFSNILKMQYVHVADAFSYKEEVNVNGIGCRRQQGIKN